MCLHIFNWLTFPLGITVLVPHYKNKPLLERKSVPLHRPIGTTAWKGHVVAFVDGGLTKQGVNSLVH